MENKTDVKGLAEMKLVTFHVVDTSLIDPLNLNRLIVQEAAALDAFLRQYSLNSKLGKRLKKNDDGNNKQGNKKTIYQWNN